MKANELMIGDWLRVSDVPTNIESKIGKSGKVAKLEQYHNYSGIAIKFDNELDTYFCEKEEELEPIPLTPEILEKNGYHTTPVYDIDDDSIVYPHIDLCGEWTWYNGKIYYGITDEEVAVMFECKYVHEFQHFLRLVGIKKEIVL